ncbi:MAG: low specificity L-threonine aldolase [Bacteroidota bacterium]|nr:low specificity L-threonine aldolase [Candidatus Kapabacteria bacterium]MDW8220576.1 low specificity L-threonine aldolase [Bacteroidota bacterium]
MLSTISQRISFASDNTAGVHPAVLAALEQANNGHAPAYGYDSLTAAAVEHIQQLFGKHTHVFFTLNGTGANVLALQAMTQSFHAILCTTHAHIYVDECGAPAKLTGCQLLAIPTPNAKLTPEMIAPYLHWKGIEHHAQPKVIALTQSTEYGTVYTLDELQAITHLARQHDMYVFMDGARLANAAASLNLPLHTFTTDAGIDAVTFGGTKNGLMMGEAIVLCNPATAPHLAANIPFLRKQSMQLCSKMRFIAAQFIALLNDNLWLENARHANTMAQRLAQGMRSCPQVCITQNVQANAVFATFPKSYITALQQRYDFYVWNDNTNEVRLMTSFDTTEQDIAEFLQDLYSLQQSSPV